LRADFYESWRFRQRVFMYLRMQRREKMRWNRSDRRLEAKQSQLQKQALRISLRFLRADKSAIVTIILPNSFYTFLLWPKAKV